MGPLKMYFLLKIVIFHCYVSLPEGTPSFMVGFSSLIVMVAFSVVFFLKVFGFVKAPGMRVMCNHLHNCKRLASRNAVLAVSGDVGMQKMRHGKCFISKRCTLPEANRSHLKMDGWNAIVSFWGPAYFQGPC